MLQLGGSLLLLQATNFGVLKLQFCVLQLGVLQLQPLGKLGKDLGGLLLGLPLYKRGFLKLPACALQLGLVSSCLPIFLHR